MASKEDWLDCVRNLQFDLIDRVQNIIVGNDNVIFEFADKNTQDDLQRYVLTQFLSYLNIYCQQDVSNYSSKELCQKGIEFINNKFDYMFDDNITLIDSNFDCSLILVGNRAFFLVRGTVLDGGFGSWTRDMINNTQIACGFQPHRTGTVETFINKHLPNLIAEGYQIEGIAHSLGATILKGLSKKYPKITMTLFNIGKGTISIPFTDKHTSLKEIGKGITGIFNPEYAGYLVTRKIINGEEFLILSNEKLDNVREFKCKYDVLSSLIQTEDGKEVNTFFHTDFDITKPFENHKLENHGEYLKNKALEEAFINFLTEITFLLIQIKEYKQTNQQLRIQIKQLERELEIYQQQNYSRFSIKYFFNKINSIMEKLNEIYNSKTNQVIVVIVSNVNGLLNLIYTIKNWDKMDRISKAQSVLNLLSHLPIPYVSTCSTIFNVIIEVKTNGFTTKTCWNLVVYGAKGVVFYYVPIVGQIYGIVKAINLATSLMYDESKLIKVKGGIQFEYQAEWSILGRRWTLTARNDFFGVNIKKNKIGKSKEADEEIKRLVEEILNKTVYRKIGISYQLMDINTDEMNFVDKIRFGLVNQLLFGYWLDKVETNLRDNPIIKDVYVYYNGYFNWRSRKTNLGDWTFLLYETPEQARYRHDNWYYGREDSWEESWFDQNKNLNIVDFLRIIYQMNFINCKDFFSLFFPSEGTIERGRDADKCSNADQYHKYRTRYENNIKDELLKIKKSNKELDQYQNITLHNFQNNLDQFEFYQLMKYVHWKLLNIELTAGYFIGVLVSTTESSFYYSFVYFDYELTAFYYYPISYPFRKTSQFCYSFVESYIIRMLASHLGLTFRFYYPLIGNEYYQSIIFPNIVAGVSLVNIALTRQINFGLVETVASRFFRANNQYLIDTFSNNKIVQYFDKEIGKGMVKNCLVKLFEYLKITQLESFLPMVEDMLGSQLTEYLVENYLLIATEVVYNISLILISRIAYQIWYKLTRLSKDQFGKYEDKPFIAEHKENPISIEFKENLIEVEFMENPIEVEFKKNQIEIDFQYQQRKYVNKLKCNSRVSKRRTKRITRRQTKRKSRR
jgi:hypothetical protein